MRTYGIDYSTKVVNLATIEDGRLLITLTVPVDFHQGLDGLERLGVSLAAAIPPEGEAWMESSWTGARTPFTGIQLARVATIVEVLACQKAIKLNRVHPNAWRPALYGKRPKPGTAKETAIEYVKRHYGLETKNHNEAEAVCLAAYGHYLLEGTLMTPTGASR